MPSDPSFGRTNLFHLVTSNTPIGQVLRRLLESGEAGEGAVVVSADQGGVVDGGGAAVGVVDDVVGLAVLRWPVTAGE
jgi:hypothetical protein